MTMWKWALLAVLVVGVGAGLIWAKVGKTTGDYIQHTIEQKEFAGRVAAELSARNLVKSHVIKNGSYPESLDDVEGLPTLPEGWIYDYDSSQGMVSIVREE